MEISFRHLVKIALQRDLAQKLLWNLSRRSCTQSSTEIFKTSQGELAESNLVRVPLLHVPCNTVWDNDQLLSMISCSQPLKLNSKSRTPFWTVHHSGTTWYNSSPDCSTMKSERPSPFLAPQNPASHWSFVPPGPYIEVVTILHRRQMIEQVPGARAARHGWCTLHGQFIPFRNQTWQWEIPY